ncbi:MAG: fibronectin type III domain-containing protein [Actinomycetota bacterium]
MTVIVIVGAVIVAGLIGYGIIASRGPAAPGTPPVPTGLHADAQTCAPPECHTIRTTVDLTWSAPPDLEGRIDYHVFRNELELKTTSGAGLTTPHFADDTAAFGVPYHYTVSVTTVGGTSGPSNSVSVTPPSPPKAVAQLSGDYPVRVTVTHVRYLATLEGIKNPSPGDTKKGTWNFTPKCAVGTGPCDTTINAIKPPLHRQGNIYSGSIARDARCVGTADVSARLSYHLKVSGAERDSVQGWRYRSFSGTYTVTLACGGLVSSGTLTVRSLGN